MKAGGGLELMLVWWSLPECLWRLEGSRVDAGLVVTAGVFMETGGASS